MGKTAYPKTRIARDSQSTKSNGFLVNSAFLPTIKSRGVSPDRDTYGLK